MKITSLCYHNVITGSAFDASGFPGVDVAAYKLDVTTFQRHLEAIEDEVQAHAKARRPGSVLDLWNGSQRQSGCLLTFDDGGASGITTIAPMLENFGWHGHFFITTDYMDAPGFLTREQIRELRRRGHVIGSHSCSHHGRMSSHTPERLVREWGISKEILSGLLGEEVTTASVPSGYFSRRVAEAAAVVGLKGLFTLEARGLVESLGGCMVFGRYLVKRNSPPRLAAKLAVGSVYPCATQWLFWNVKKLVRTGLGNS